MKKFLLIFAAVVLTAFSADVFAQATINQKNAINSTRVYSVNYDGTNHDAAHVGNTYTWAVYLWNGSTDYSLSGWTASAADPAADYTFTGSSTGANIYSSTITWEKGGYYVVEVTETGLLTNCTTKRRFGVQVFDLDLLVQTFDTDGTTEFTSNQSAVCNTNSGGIWTSDDDDNLNASTGVNPALGTMVYTYKVTLYTAKKGVAGTEIGTVLPTAKWRFLPISNSTIPATIGDVDWAITSTGAAVAAGSVMDGTNYINVDETVSEVTITATIKNIAADEAAQYKLNFAIAPGTVQIEDGGSIATDYAEGTEPATYIGGETPTVLSHVNAAWEIIVNPIPNTSTISSN